MVSNPNGVNLHASIRNPAHYKTFCFKPQRGKFTHYKNLQELNKLLCFKPQRGKFTHSQTYLLCPQASPVSNPNGVNLHTRIAVRSSTRLYCFKPQRGKFTLGRFLGGYHTRFVSNPNGVNLHFKPLVEFQATNGFKPQRGKFTRPRLSTTKLRPKSFKPQRGKFTPPNDPQRGEKRKSFKPQRGKFTRVSTKSFILLEIAFQTPTG